MSKDNQNFNFSSIIPLADQYSDNTEYSQMSDRAKREIAVVSALQLINTSLSSSSANCGLLKYAPDHLTVLVTAILKEMDGGE
jgi:hypothetical protein